MVCVSDPGNSSASGDKDSKVGEKTSDQDRNVFISTILIGSDYLKDQPGDTRCCTARVDTTEMLKHRGASQSEFERCPLSHEKSYKRTDILDRISNKP